MAVPSIKKQLIETLDQLNPEQQQKLLDFARHLRTPLPPGTSGEFLLSQLDAWRFEPGDFEDMMQAIEEACERIDPDGWQ